jgi:hypothetical protein
LRTSCLTDSTFKSRFITAFGTYHGLSVIILNTFDWNSVAFTFHTFHPHSSLFVSIGSAKNKKKINVKYKTESFQDNLKGLRAFFFAAVTKNLT